LQASVKSSVSRPHNPAGDNGRHQKLHQLSRAVGMPTSATKSANSGSRPEGIRLSILAATVKGSVGSQGREVHFSLNKPVSFQEKWCRGFHRGTIRFSPARFEQVIRTSQ
jgi:hypothetical protein